MRERYTEVVETAPELRYFDASPEARAAITEQLRAALAERPEIRLAYLLGSFAEARPFRDIDIAVYLEPEFLQKVDPLHYCFQLADVLERVVGYPVDVHRLNDAPCGFRFSATCGRVLLSRDEAFRSGVDRAHLARVCRVRAVSAYVSARVAAPVPREI
jgi:predicted nucleotidyltransferase